MSLTRALPDWTVTRHRGGTVRLWHNDCVKRVELPEIDRKLIAELERRHVCGPVGSRWEQDR